MNAPTFAVRDAGRYDLTQLSDGELLTGTRQLVGTSNQLFADLLAHLAEVEARGIHRLRACSSLYTYCIYELRFSEDAAFRRATAAKLVRMFPVLFDAVASGELHLTGLLLLGPHLTHANHVEVLARAKHRTKKEIAQLIRQIDPLPDVPARIEPLGPATAAEGGAVANPTWQQFVRSANVVRQLALGERPRDWIDEATSFETEAALARCELTAPSDEAALARCELTAPSDEPALARCELTTPSESATAPNEAAPRRLSPLSGPRRYRVQFTATEEYVQLVERAKALLSHAALGASLGELHLRAMQALVVQLEKRRYGAAAPPTKSEDGRVNADSARASISFSEPGSESDDARERDPRRRGRYLAAAVRREVYERDAARCAYVDAMGERCRETQLLEIHHLQPFACGGAHGVDNLTLRCRAHNQLCAEQDFGRLTVEKQGQALRHGAESSRG